MIDIDDMKKLASAGKASRREFIQFALAAGIGVAAAETMFGEAVAATPKQGGSARFGLAHGATTDTLDPAGYPDTGTQVPWGAMSSCSLPRSTPRAISPPICSKAWSPSTGPRPGASSF
jgi:peptide/nickel transport system substrate-binding protein